MSSSPDKRVLIVQRSLSPPGGGNAVAAWMVHALAGACRVATLTASPWSVQETNAFYGTAIPEGAVRQHTVPAPWKWLSGLSEDRLTRVRMAAVLRYARPLAAQYDLLVTADNYAAFAKPGIQYVHYPADLEPRPARMPQLVNVYFAACNRLLGARWTDAARNITFANSRWTAAGLERLGEVSTPIVLYPPVIDPGEGLPWDRREDTFLCIGRFHGSKRVELAMSIVGRARAAALPNARLIIVGSAVDGEYTSRIVRMAAQHGDWIEFREDLSRQELNQLMGRVRYGLQAMENEHFGMATAEMTRAGCLVFAHNSGGTPEVLNNEAALLWESEGEAVKKIVNLRNVDALRGRLRDRAQMFSAETFVTEFRKRCLTPTSEAI
ncbi:MAG TPA: glycosyltransferase [Vicinamibacterales bacterium]